MAKVNYYLKNVPSEEALLTLKRAKDKSYNDEMLERRPIVMSVAHNNKRELFATGKFISLKFWDRGSKRIKRLVETPETSRKDADWLDQKKLEVEKFLQNARSEHRAVSKDDLYEVIHGEIKTKKNNNTLKEILADFLIDHKTNKGASLKANTKKTYTSLIGHIAGFQGNDLFKPELYTTKWVKNFKQYLLDVAKSNDNTVWKYIKALKAFFAHLRKAGHRITAELNEIKVSETDQIINTINIDELKILEAKEFDNPIHRHVCDIFLFQCYTGARYSDIQNIKADDLTSGEYKNVWEYIAVKTGDQISAPLTLMALKILDRYKNLTTPLPVYTNQTVNKELKDIAKLAELNRRVKKRSFSDNKINETWHPLHEIISTHMARKTFITISLDKGVPERIVKKVSGHRDERSFKKYVNLNDTFLDAIQNAWNGFNL